MTYGYRVMYALIEQGQWKVKADRCPYLSEELGSFKTNTQGKYEGSHNHALDAVRYYLTSEGETLAIEPRREVPLRDQPTLYYRPGVGDIDNPAAERAKANYGDPIDKFWGTWTDRQGFDKEAADKAAHTKLMTYLTGTPT